MSFVRILFFITLFCWNINIQPTQNYAKKHMLSVCISAINSYVTMGVIIASLIGSCKLVDASDTQFISGVGALGVSVFILGSTVADVPWNPLQAVDEFVQVKLLKLLPDKKERDPTLESHMKAARFIGLLNLHDSHTSRYATFFNWMLKK